ncbi:hypothetical protein B0H12DRAFT_1074516 [Mycena haematopus]|nr:hypothetical protein B0H12DRAFT_1074516 [Mycena haematopus]
MRDLIEHTGGTKTITDKHLDLANVGADDDSAIEDKTRVNSDDEQKEDEDPNNEEEKEGEEDEREKEEEEEQEEESERKEKRKLTKEQKAFQDLRKRKLHVKLTKRAEGIIGASNGLLISANELFNLMMVPVKRTYEQNKDCALACLLRGYETAGTYVEWNAQTNIEDFVKNSTRFDRDSAGTVYQWDLLISDSELVRNVDYNLDAILHKLETIKFVHAWNRLTGQELFKFLHPDDFRNLSKKDAAENVKLMDVELKAFNRKRSDMITARNRL